MAWYEQTGKSIINNLIDQLYGPLEEGYLKPEIGV
jgi:hypothetical protein